MHQFPTKLHWQNTWRIPALILLLLLTGCQSGPAVTAPIALPPSQTPPPPTATATSTATALPTPTPTALPWAGFAVSSPLADLSLSDLQSILSEPFSRPAPGEDGGHHGTDFAYYTRGSHTTMVGLPIYSMLPGIAAGVTEKKNPYGNLVIIETTFNRIPPDFLARLSIPDHLSPYPYDPRLIYCGPLKNQQWQADPASLYILYGHLVEPSTLKVGDPVSSGQQLGGVGNTGLSGNPHLHLEMRVGPADSRFLPMAYYDTSATPDENLTYCDWRVSGKYYLLDPMEWINTWLTFESAGGG